MATTVSYRRAEAPRAAHASGPEADAQLTLNLPAHGTEMAPRQFSEPPNAAMDFRWMW
jgi:hypothetical protein